MSTATASVFFALLALGASVGTVAVIVLLIAARHATSAVVIGLRDDVGRVALALAWVVALVATAGSLYYSEIAHLTPCKLCWYQRILMYPLTLLLGIATIRRDRNIRIYVIVQGAVGLAIAGYHSFIQAFPPDGGTSFCSVDAPCTARYVWEFGFVSLPFMSFAAFAFIVGLMFAVRPAASLAIEGDPDE